MDNDNAKRKFDLEDRLVRFVGLVGQLTDKLNLSYESQNLKNKLNLMQE